MVTTDILSLSAKLGRALRNLASSSAYQLLSSGPFPANLWWEFPTALVFIEHVCTTDDTLLLFIYMLG
jgi:hypothetical protein